MDINSAVGRKAGLTDEQLRALSRSPSLNKGFAVDSLSVFNDKERLVIELADAMADTPANVSEDLYVRLRHLFSEEQLLELGAQLAFEHYRARLNRVFEVESDELYLSVPVAAHKNTEAGAVPTG